MKKNILPLVLFQALILPACSLAPEYQEAQFFIPEHYKETGKWVKTTAPSKENGKWWEIYHDPVLNQLQEEVSLCNPNLQAALWRYENAKAAVAVAQSGYYPTLTGVASAERIKQSANVANPFTNLRYNDRLIGADLSYEIDFWGRVRNTVAASKYLAKASEADLSAIDLSLHAALANNYFSLRGADASIRALDELVGAYQKALDLTVYRYEGGAAPEGDVDQAKTQLENVKTLATDTRLKRAQFEHAIAALVGKVPADFSITPTTYQVKFLPIASELPSTLLQRRPDIIASKDRVMAANAQIGVARAAFFPDVNLIGDIGFESASFRNLIGMPSLFWSLGPQVAQILFDGGKIRGLLDQAKASYFETVANYRQTVLSAFQDVEDNLAAERLLAKELVSQASATDAANRALKQSLYRYQGGLTTYLDVVVTQNIALQAELALIDLNTRRQITNVMLIKALGGGWCET